MVMRGRHHSPRRRAPARPAAQHPRRAATLGLCVLYREETRLQGPSRVQSRRDASHASTRASMSHRARPPAPPTHPASRCPRLCAATPHRPPRRKPPPSSTSPPPPRRRSRLPPSTRAATVIRTRRRPCSSAAVDRARHAGRALHHYCHSNHRAVTPSNIQVPPPVENELGVSEELGDTVDIPLN
ncbi:hypothetical protein DFH06DRAFT_1203700 [Mycena polygramma]|nr:hypothetical protein DFH06DRAFT_1203700 [Mycena polygramma]